MSRSALTRAGVALGAAAGACVAYGTFIEREWYRYREVHLTGALPPGTAGVLRVLHVSDVHLDPPQTRRTDFLASLVELDADLVVATGDLVGAVGAEVAAADALAPLLSGGIPGVVVLGSNDVFGPTPKGPHVYFLEPDARLHGPRLDTAALVDRLTSHGYRTLRNEAVTIDTAIGPVSIGGLDDPHLADTVLPPKGRVAADPACAATIGLVHAPYTKALDHLVDAGYRLLLSGHTHGGQVRFPPFGAVLANCDLPLDQVRGASRYGDAWLHVSPGLGTSRYAPFRFACRPEATLLHLTA